jgi:hypothetical protein
MHTRTPARTHARMHTRSQACTHEAPHLLIVGLTTKVLVVALVSLHLGRLLLVADAVGSLPEELRSSSLLQRRRSHARRIRGARTAAHALPVCAHVGRV